MCVSVCGRGRGGTRARVRVCAGVGVWAGVLVMLLGVLCLCLVCRMCVQHSDRRCLMVHQSAFCHRLHFSADLTATLMP
jgi:hypothetical protein